MTQPPDAKRVAARALALAAVVCRSALERDAGNPGAEAVHRDLREWVQLADIRDELGSPERTLIDAPLGSLTSTQSQNASWRGEGLAVLGWALQRCALPPFATAASAPDIADELGFFCARDETVLATLALRALDDLRLFAEQIADIHWRFREFARTRLPVSYATFARTYMHGRPDFVQFAFVDDDLSIDGRSILETSAARRAECASIAQERHQAASWLLGTETFFPSSRPILNSEWVLYTERCCRQRH